MLHSIKKLIGDKGRQLIVPIVLMSLDAIGSLVMYLMLYFTVVHLLSGTLSGSGMPKTTWCREHGISDKAFFYWQRILREEAYLTTLERARLGRRWILASL